MSTLELSEHFLYYVDELNFNSVSSKEPLRDILLYFDKKILTIIQLE